MPACEREKRVILSFSFSDARLCNLYSGMNVGMGGLPCDHSHSIHVHLVANLTLRFPFSCGGMRIIPKVSVNGNGNSALALWCWRALHSSATFDLSSKIRV